METSNTYVAGSIGYEFVLCTNLRRHLFAVLQRPHEHVHIHELNLHDGHLVHDLKLQDAKPNQTFLCATTTTLHQTDTGKEFFAVGLQSGLIFIINTNPLHVHCIINGKDCFPLMKQKLSHTSIFVLNSYWKSTSDHLVGFLFINFWLYLNDSERLFTRWNVNCFM